MRVAPPSEKELVLQLKLGSEKAFNLLFHQYERRLFAFSFKMLLSSEDAEEVVQEVFFKIWKNKRFLNEEMCFRAYIFTVARNHVYNLLSKRVSETAYKKYSAGLSVDPTSSTEEAYDFQELKEVVLQKLDKMPEKRRKVFMMSRFDGLSNKDIASQLNLSLRTVESHIHKALKLIKQQLYIRDIHFFIGFAFLWL